MSSLCGGGTIFGQMADAVREVLGKLAAYHVLEYRDNDSSTGPANRCNPSGAVGGV